MVRQIRNKLLLFAVFGALQVSLSQTGMWVPAGMDTAYPRTLCKMSAASAIRDSLSAVTYYPLFSGVYSSALSTVPSGTTNTDRLLKSQIAKNAAFIVFIQRKVASGIIVQLPSDEAENLIAKSIGIMDSFLTSVDRITIFNPSAYDSWQWRSKELIDFCIAYDLLRGAGVSAGQLQNAQTRIQEFTGKLYDESTRLIAPPLYPYSFFDLVFNNHAVMTASALGMAAVVINTASSSDTKKQPLSWIHAAMWLLENSFFIDTLRQSQPNSIAGYAEGPGYFRYGMLNFLPFARAMGNILPQGNLQYTYKSMTRTIPNPYYDDRIFRLYEWAARIRMPDGRLPSLEDTQTEDFFPELAFTGRAEYIWKNAFSKIRFSYTLSSQLMRANTDLRANYICAFPPAPSRTDSGLYAMPSAGSLVFRSSNDSSATYLHVTAKNGITRSSSLGHNQADVTSFLLYSRGEMLALDPGYVSYSRRGETGNAQNHNMILVDGGGPAIGSPSSSNDADGYIENAFSLPLLHYGEARTSYAGADIVRRFLFARSKYFLNADAVSSSSPHTFTWQLHGHGLEGGNPAAEGSFQEFFAQGRGVWTKGSQTLLSQVLPFTGSAVYSKVTRPHEVAYDSTENHTAMNVATGSVMKTGFVSVLYPYESVPPTVQNIITPAINALRITDSTYKDIAFAQNDTLTIAIDSVSSTLSRTISSDASFCYFSYDTAAAYPAQWFIRNGRAMKYGNTTVTQSSVRCDFTFQKCDSATFRGYINRAATVTFAMRQRVLSVSGSGVAAWRQRNADEMTITFSGATQFVVSTIPAVTNRRLSLSVFLEGQYNPNTFSHETDTLSVLLRGAQAPYPVLDSLAVISDGECAAFFTPEEVRQSSYLEIKHRNHLETWSATPVLFGNEALEYDFTSSATSAYGSNLKLIAGKYCIYAGDVTRDGFIDFSDLVPVDNDQFNFVSGYVATDLTGDNFVDFSDLVIVDNNQFNFIGKITPEGGMTPDQKYTPKPHSGGK